MAIAVSHPEARIRGDEFYNLEQIPEEYTVALERFVDFDHEEYIFQDPGTPENNENTNQCAHCHVTINEEWHSSVHAQSASNSTLHHLYSGSALYQTEEDCIAQGGAWKRWPVPGTSDEENQCFLGVSLWETFNADCASPLDCEVTQSGFCADCHAPGIDGVLGGRDLLEAQGRSYEYGVHCDVCHKVESVALDSLNPGVGGALRILRPSEPPFPGSIANAIMFGPHGDVLNPRMGSVQRDHFSNADLCFGCHQFDQPILVEDDYDVLRWPEGRIPVHSTYAELKEGPLADIACQSCHMPPDPEVGNGADLGNIFSLEPDLATGWYRLPGQVRKHGWYGPRSEKPMLALAASLNVEQELVGEDLLVSIRVKNVGPGHAIPTGEPSRMMILVVDAFCGTEELIQTEGAVVSDIGGYREKKSWGEDWLDWPQAQLGDRLRVVEYTSGFYDYNGFGMFALGNWDASQKGLRKERLLADRTVVGMDDSGVVLDGSLPEGDVVYWVSSSDIVDGMESVGWAGHAGFSFARVLADGLGRKMVPHFLAVDVLSDNRLLPQDSWTSEHIFTSSCTEPIVQAALLYRDQPLWLSREKGWESYDRVMVQQ
jgi:hypothetical protein